MSENRRTFLKQAGAGVVGASAWGLVRTTRAAGANERVAVGLIGCGGRGPGVADDMGGIAYVCDPDRNRLAEAAKKFGVPESQAVSDLRRVLDDDSVDAVIIATPDHWHAPAAILACEAGKHVYVEKPWSHSFRESQLLVDAARRNKVIVQHGTQSRSDPLIAGAIQMLRDGVIGDVLVAKAWNVQRRGNIGHGTPSEPPPGVDYDTWVGPAEFVPFQKNRFHYDWHWWYNFGTGDIGNDGVHEIDYARWGLGVDTLPARVTGLGGKYFFDDDQEFPDTATIAYEYPGAGPGEHRQLIFEMRIWSTNYPYQIDNGTEFYGTKGRMLLSKRGKLEIYGERNERIKVEPREVSDLPSHQADFLNAIRTGQKPRADIDEAHRSVALVHLGNIAVRLQRSLDFDPQSEQIVGDQKADRLLRRQYRQEGHWAIPKGASA